MIKIRIHAIAGIIAFLTILTFWLSTLISETLGSHADIAAVENAILWGMIVLIPCLIMTGATGVSLGKGWADPRISAKKTNGADRQKRANHPGSLSRILGTSGR